MILGILKKINDIITNIKDRIEVSVREMIRKQRDKIGLKKIQQHINNLKPNEELRVILGGHWANNPNWLILKEIDQDITKLLKFKNDSVDVIFTEHVIEHISFNETIFFMKESKRILKKGGTFRIVCPMLEKLISVDFSSKISKSYVNNFLVHHFSLENKNLVNLNLDGIFESPKIFLFNSMFKLFQHKFIWSADLMVKVLKALKFTSVKIYEVGNGSQTKNCVERKFRGIDQSQDWSEEKLDCYDPESMVVEAIK